MIIYSLQVCEYAFCHAASFFYLCTQNGSNGSSIAIIILHLILKMFCFVLVKVTGARGDILSCLSVSDCALRHAFFRDVVSVISMVCIDGFLLNLSTMHLGTHMKWLGFEVKQLNFNFTE